MRAMLLLSLGTLLGHEMMRLGLKDFYKGESSRIRNTTEEESKSTKDGAYAPNKTKKGSFSVRFLDDPRNYRPITPQGNRP